MNFDYSLLQTNLTKVYASIFKIPFKHTHTPNTQIFPIKCANSNFVFN